MKKNIDLHVHSNCSDGTLSPEELVVLAHKKKLSAFALTDHDTIDGVIPATKVAETYGIELIPGIELSTNYKEKDIHILGLGIDITNHYFQDELIKFQNSRDLRNLKMIEKLQQAGIDITYEKMKERFSDSVLTRAHFAKFLEENNYISNMWDAFPKYIGDNAPCFVSREKVTPFQAIQLIHESGGYAFLAHPLLYNFSTSDLELLLQELAAAHLDGIEAIYSTNRKMDEANMKMLAKKYQLKISGGSDFHGANKPNIQLGTGKGNLNISYELWNNIQSK